MIWGSKGSQHFVVLGKYTDGLERDVTAAAQFSASGAGQGDIERSGTFVARSSGEVVLTAKLATSSAQARIRIEGVDKPRPFTFSRDIERIFTKRGCNDSSCHGGVKGRGGFKLSVYGLFPRDDYDWIVNGGTFRVLTTDADPKHPRINAKEPEKSLLLLKPTLSVAHGGGLRFEAGSTDYSAILNWVRAGTPYGDGAEKEGIKVQRVEVSPKEIVLERGARYQLAVTAYLLNGRQEDISEQVRYISNNAQVVEVSDAGMVESKGRGETNVLVRAPGRTLSVDVGVIEHPVTNYPKIEARNYIDEAVFAKLKRFQILPSMLSSDQEFLRRVCLDLTGTLPPPSRVREFIADKDPHKRDRLIEILLNSPEYVDYWSFRFNDLMRTRFMTANNVAKAKFYEDATKGYQDWVTNSIATNKPYDQLARERIAAQGYSAPARNLYSAEDPEPPELVMPEMVRVFMGRRIECAQCHNHPFEAWTQNQFWGLAAFFAGFTELRDLSLVIDVLGGGHVDQPKQMMVVNPRTKEKVVPAFLDGGKLPQDKWLDPRMRLAEWITSHPYFAEAAVNRIWSNFFNRGIVEPIDDFRSTNPPTHPELLDALAKDFRDSGYDLKHLMRRIVQSRTYQLSGIPNETNKDDQINYSHSQPRPLEAAVLLDAITSATGVPEKFEFTSDVYPDLYSPRGVRAMQTIPDLCPSQFMDVFGRSMRKALPLERPRPTLLEALDTLAGSAYTTKISEKGSRLERLLTSGTSDEEIMDEFYLAALTRLPNPGEKAKLLAFLNQRSSRREETLAGLVWAVVSSREFAYNH
jgi:hypothetical protein